MFSLKLVYNLEEQNEIWRDFGLKNERISFQIGSTEFRILISGIPVPDVPKKMQS